MKHGDWTLNSWSVQGYYRFSLKKKSKESLQKTSFVLLRIIPFKWIMIYLSMAFYICSFLYFGYQIPLHFSSKFSWICYSWQLWELLTRIYQLTVFYVQRDKLGQNTQTWGIMQISVKIASNKMQTYIPALCEIQIDDCGSQGCMHCSSTANLTVVIETKSEWA